MAGDTKTIGQIIGSRMREYRQTLGLTQEEVERLSGVPQASISRLEREESEDIQVSTVLELARALSLTIDELIGLTPEEYKKAKRPARRGRGPLRALDIVRPPETSPKTRAKASPKVKPNAKASPPKRARARTAAKAAKG